MNENNTPTRRGFLAAAIPATIFPASVALPPAAPLSPFLGPHNPAEAEHDSCLCRRCIEERMERGAHPLIQRVAVAGLRAGAAVDLLWYSHAAPCPAAEDGCDVCQATEGAIFNLTLYRGCVESWTTAGPAVEQAERECGRVTRAAGGGRFPKFPPARGDNPPAAEPAVLALLDFEHALQALLDGHQCPDDCEACTDSHGIRLGVRQMIDNLNSSLIPTEAIMRREGSWPAELR